MPIYRHERKPAPLSQDILNRFDAYGKKHSSWGPLHLVLEDDNVEDRHVNFCINDAIEQGDKEAEVLGRILLTLSHEQRIFIGSDRRTYGSNCS